ncbi:N-acetylmuramoyl-L-alanine amidase [Metaclostridioides mangenotii]|uniref:N-acetylmuramoyl-L-alanine amidase n=1 Tax=Metaclostridioides mangenotii TaxID=1540 RepID=UPI0004853012|nr:N-acetylmuramoyl-L-alanine amidase [Clostridioides mangenotii]
MRKLNKIFATGMLSMALVTPNIAIVANASTVENNNSDLNINLEKKSVLLGTKSNASVKFKEKPNADSITLNFLCYDMELEATLNYNESTGEYEGVIEYNKDPEYLNVWELQSIKINNPEKSEVLNKKDLQNMGLKLSDYDVTQEFIISDANSTKELRAYTQKTSAPITQLSGDVRYDTAVAISKEAYPSGAKTVVIVNGDLSSDGIAATPLATANDAPILLSYKNNLPSVTKQELKRLNPNKVIVIGDSGSVSDNVISEIKSTVNVTSTTRLGGKDRMATSLLIAKELDKTIDVKKVYIANGYQEYDALNIASKSGQDKQPIILTNKEAIPDETLTWLKGEDLETAYFIGGEASIDTNVIHQMSAITPSYPTNSDQNIYKHRVSGSDRHETNAKVISYFYPQEEYNAMLVAKSDVIVDALAAGPLAAKLNSPILITPKTYVSAYHTDNLNAKKANKVYQIGGGMRDSVIQSIATSLSKHTTTPDPGTGNKTVVIDPGHGGSDSGAVSSQNGGAKEKEYTLNTALATTEYLRSQGINVVMTRDTDKTMALGERTAISNQVKPDLFTSIHYNSFNASASGVEVFYQLKDKNGGTTKTAATNILNSILAEFDYLNRGIKTRALSNSPNTDYLYVLRNNNYPSILVECAFIDSAKDMGQLKTNEQVKKMGTQVGKGIVKTLN